jgi:hypothetical protein
LLQISSRTALFAVRYQIANPSITVISNLGLITPLDDSVFETATIQTFVGAKEEQEIKGIFKSDLGSNLNYQARSEINHDDLSL